MADKTQTIKYASDEELEALLTRLRKERELQNIICDLKRNSVPSDPNNYDYNNGGVSTEQPIDNMYHFGILGMHWGVRRNVGSNGRIIDNSVSDDFKNARVLKRKGVKNLSNVELKSYVERVGLENQFVKLNKKEVSAGRKFVQDIVVGSGKQALTTFVGKQMSNQLDNLVKK